MAYVTHHTVATSAQERGLSVAFSKLAARYSQYRKFRTTFNELSGLSDRDLHDLGLNRSMIRRVAIEASREH